MVAGGELIGGRYRLVAPLATGGMGTVWRAHHVELDVDVALKLMSRESASDALGEQRFRREAQAAARLRSPHIVQVLDFGMWEGQPYLAMELMEGEDLEARLGARGKLSLAECVAVVDGVAKALALAHDAGLVHRDLKPGNIFLARAGAEELAKVLDFGVAKDLRVVRPDEARTVGVVGTPAYMSPEQVWGEEIGPPSDLWSLAVVAFETLAGSNPFADDTLARIFDRILREDLPRIRDSRPELPAAVDAFFERALARDPAARFGSARELAEAFRAAVATCAGARDDDGARPAMVVLAAPPEEPGALAPERAQGRRGLVAAAVLALAAAGIAIGMARRDPSPPAEPSIAAPASTGAVTSVAPTEPAPPHPAASPTPPPVVPEDRTPRPSAAPVLRPPPPRRLASAPTPAPSTSLPPSPAPPAPPGRDPRFGIPLDPTPPAGR
jgi:serine/threonine-protein kinase